MELQEEEAQQSSSLNLVRRFALASLVTIVVASVILGFLLRDLAVNNLTSVEEDSNIALSQLLRNTLWPKYGDFLKAAGEMDANEIRAHRSTQELLREIRSMTAGIGIEKIKVFNTGGKTVFSTRLEEIGGDKSASEEFQQSLSGQNISKLSFRDVFYGSQENLDNRNILSTYIPIQASAGQSESAKVLGVFELYRDVTGLVEQIKSTRMEVILDVAVVLGITYLILFVMMHQADRMVAEKEIENNKNREKIEFAAYHDTLTHLPNRRLFLDRLECAMPRSIRNERLLGIMFIDLDRFKHINDSMGHNAGDDLLKVVAERLKRCVRQYDTIARQGGDEFTILLEEIAHVDEIVTIADRILENLQKPLQVQSRDIVISASIGITIYPFDDLTMEHLLQNADAAMYKAKEEGRNKYVLYSAGMNVHNRNRLEMESNLRKALEDDEYQYYLQPQVDVRSGRMCGAEVLLRWQHKDFGLISPAEFVPVLEDCGLICTVGKWILQKSCEQFCCWQAAGYPPFKLSVNVSAVQFRQINFTRIVQEVLDETGMDPKWLTLELTESMLIDNLEASCSKLNQLKEMGVKIALDDFGTGYSSLSYLKKFPIDTLKIDRSFVQNVHKSSDNAAIVTAIIALAHSLKLNVVAEGVEDPRELTYLAALGCNVIQGYFFSRPLPMNDFESILSKQDVFEEILASARN